MRRYIASDFHVGNDVTDYDRVMGFLDLVEEDADEFLILGDWLELLWSNMTIVTTMEPYRSVVEKVRAIARNKPVKLVLGNHDWNIDLFDSEIEPIEVVEPFAENGVYYCHGFEFDWVSIIAGTPVDPIYWRMHFPFSLPPAWGLWIINKWFIGEEDAYFWGIAFIHERVRAYAVKNGYNTVVFGHTHFPCEEIRGGIKLYNCGDMVDSYSYLVQEDGNIELKFY